MPRPTKTTLVSFQHAFDGIAHVFRTQRRVQLEALVSVLVIAQGAYVRLPREDWFLVLVAIALVFLSEMINTAIAACVDLFAEKYHPAADRACTIASGASLFAVLIAAIMIASVFLRPPL